MCGKEKDWKFDYKIGEEEFEWLSIWYVRQKEYILRGFEGERHRKLVLNVDFLNENCS